MIQIEREDIHWEISLWNWVRSAELFEDYPYATARRLGFAQDLYENSTAFFGRHIL